MTAKAKPSAGQYALEIARIVEAPRDLAFRIWTRPEHLMRWWGPKDFTSSCEKLEFREGGAYRFTIYKDDHRHGMSGVYRDIVTSERIVFTFAWDNEVGQPGNETLITVTFEVVAANKTRITFSQTPFETVESRDSHAEGWGECLDRLEAYLSDL